MSDAKKISLFGAGFGLLGLLICIINYTPEPPLNTIYIVLGLINLGVMVWNIVNFFNFD